MSFSGSFEQPGSIEDSNHVIPKEEDEFLEPENIESDFDASFAYRDSTTEESELYPEGDNLYGSYDDSGANELDQKKEDGSEKRDEKTEEMSPKASILTEVEKINNTEAEFQAKKERIAEETRTKNIKLMGERKEAEREAIAKNLPIPKNNLEKQGIYKKVEQEEMMLSQAKLQHHDIILKIEKFVLDFGHDLNDIEDFWIEYDAKFADKGIESRQNAERIKREILANVAVENLMRDLETAYEEKNKETKTREERMKKANNNNNGRSILARKKTGKEKEAEKHRERIAEYWKKGDGIKIDIELPEPKEDMDQNIDFYINARCTDSDGNIRTRKLPCRVVFVDTSINLSDDRENRDRNSFVHSIYANFKCPDMDIAKKYLSYTEREKMKRFYISGEEGERLLIVLPEFGKNAVSETGMTNDTFRKNFLNKLMDDENFQRNFLP